MSNHVVVVGGSKGLGSSAVASFIKRGFELAIISRNHPAADDQNSHHVPIVL